MICVLNQSVYLLLLKEGGLEKEIKLQAGDMMKSTSEIRIPLSQKLSSDGYQQIDLFKARFNILWDNWESLKKQGIKLGGGFRFHMSHPGKKFYGNSCNVESFRLKGFYVDFRFFCAKKEKTYIFTIANIISKHCSDYRLRSELVRIKKKWNNAFAFKLLGFSADQMLDYWFKGEIFHNIKEYRKGLLAVLEIMNSDLAHHVLMLSLRDRMVALEYLYWIVEPLSFECQEIRTPAKDHSIHELIHK